MTVSVNGRHSHNYIDGVLVKEVLNPANEVVERGHYAATTLSAVDGDLQAANIRLAENIFGFIGTVAPGALAEDVEGDTKAAFTPFTYSNTQYYDTSEVLSDGETLTLATKTLNFDANSLAFAAAFANTATPDSAVGLKYQLYMGGVLMQTSGWISRNDTINVVLRDFKALSGSQACELKVINPVGDYGDIRLQYYGGISSGAELPAAIAVGSVKLA